jgi:hypothetical protein
MTSSEAERSELVTRILQAPEDELIKARLQEEMEK